MDKCTIREAVRKDVKPLEELYRAFLSETTAGAPDAEVNPQLDVRRRLEKMMRSVRSEVLVADFEGTLVAFAWVEMRKGTGVSGGFASRVAEALTGRQSATPLMMPERGWLTHLYVTPGQRRQGLGTAMLGAARDWVSARGGKTLELNVLATNAAARRFYENLGMTEVIVTYRTEL